MYYYEVAPRKLIRADAETFTFESSDKLAIGAIVLVQIGRSSQVGIITKLVAKPTYQTKPIVQLIEGNPLPKALLQTAFWLRDFYATPLGTVLQTVLPTGLQKTRRSSYQTPLHAKRKRTNIVFTKHQQAALQQIESTESGSMIIHGVTGSGKTTLYIESAKQALASGKSSIILVPEIALTSQLVAEFSQHFPDVIVTHSRQTEAERHLAWTEALNSKTPRAVIGPRSALFMPLYNIGLIVIDEFHEPSFKQEQAPRYAATQLASVLAKHHQAKLLLGSATPPVSDYFLAKHHNRPIVELPETARSVTKPETNLVDMTKRDNFSKHRFLSDKLLASIDSAIESKQQVLIFHNRRGSASSTLCENCGWQASCPNCFIPLALHADKFQLRCHVCGHTETVPTSCPDCGKADIIHKGIGTKLIEHELARLYPGVEIARFDGDNAATESLDAKYQDIYDGKISIIIGTQSIAKGLDLPKLKVVGVVQADAGLHLPDFAASERTFQLLAQVVGRVGRSSDPTEIIVQTYQPKHQIVIDGISQNYSDFYKYTLAERKKSHFPPYTYLLKITVSYKTEAAAIKNIQKIAADLRRNDKSVTIFGPTPAFYERVRDTYRWQIVVKSSKRAALLQLTSKLPAKNVSFELDPTSLL